MDATQPQPAAAAAAAGSLSWRLSAHPITLLTFLGFRIGESLVLWRWLPSPHLSSAIADHVWNAASILVYFLGGLLLTDSMCVDRYHEIPTTRKWLR